MEIITSIISPATIIPSTATTDHNIWTVGSACIIGADMVSCMGIALRAISDASEVMALIEVCDTFDSPFWIICDENQAARDTPPSVANL